MKQSIVQAILGRSSTLHPSGDGVTHPSGTGNAARDLKEMGPWAPILVLLIFYLVMGLDISLGGAEDDPRYGYLFLGLFVVIAVAGVRWRRQPRTMAMFCLVLIVLQAGLAAAALTSSAVDFGLPFIVIAGLIFGMLGVSSVLFWRRSSGASTATPAEHSL